MGLFSTIGGLVGMGSTNKAYDKYGDALTAGVQALRQGLTDTESRIKPTADIGQSAINRLSGVLGGDMSQFYQSPDYQYARDESLRDIQANAASKGVLMSGNTLKDLEKNAGGLASQNYNSFLNNLSSLFTQANPYLTAYNQIPYVGAQNQANFHTALGANARDAGLAKANQWAGIGSGLDDIFANGLFSTGGGGSGGTSGLFASASSPQQGSLFSSGQLQGTDLGNAMPWLSQQGNFGGFR